MGIKSSSVWAHATWNLEHRPLKIQKLQSHTLWTQFQQTNSDDFLTQTSGQLTQRFRNSLNDSKTLSHTQKTNALQQSHQQKFKEHVRYIKKKVHQKKGEDWNMNHVLRSPYVGAVTLKSSVDDDSLFFSMYSKKIIGYINSLSTPIQFFCDGSFSFINHLQLLIIGTYIPDSNFSEFFPFGILITNRKTELGYKRFFQELKDSGKWIWKKHSFTGMTDMELGIANAAQQVFPNSQWHLCWFHITQNVIEKLNALALPKVLVTLIFKEIQKIHFSSKVSDAKIIWNQLRSNLETSHDVNLRPKFDQFIQYFNQFYCADKTLDRWITKVDPNGVKLDATNNAIERFNLHLKRIIFHDKKLKRIERAIKILHFYFELTEQTLGIIPSTTPITSSSDHPTDDSSVLESFLVQSQGLSVFLNEHLGSKLGGKRKRRQSKFMDPPHYSRSPSAQSSLDDEDSNDGSASEILLLSSAKKKKELSCSEDENSNDISHQSNSGTCDDNDIDDNEDVTSINKSCNDSDNSGSIFDAARDEDFTLSPIFSGSDDEEDIQQTIFPVINPKKVDSSLPLISPKKGPKKRSQFQSLETGDVSPIPKRIERKNRNIIYPEEQKDWSLHKKEVYRIKELLKSMNKDGRQKEVVV